MGVAVWRVARANPEFAKSTGGPVESEGPDNAYTFEFPLTDLEPGLYEVGHVQLSMAPANHAPSQIEEWKARQPNAGRCIFEVVETPRQVSASEIEEEVKRIEQRLEHEFLQPVEAHPMEPGDAVLAFAVFVFVRGMLIGTKMRFPEYEVVGLKQGLRDRDELEQVNAFLRDFTSSGVQFNYDTHHEELARSNAPVCVFHFPTVLASDPERAARHADQQTELALLSLTLTRDSSGNIFETVVIGKTAPVAKMFSRRDTYRGNLLVGPIAGEHPEQIWNYTRQLARKDIDRFLVTVYKEARAEPSPDFQYVRLWSIIEMLADLRNYADGDPLLDYAGKQMPGPTGPLTMKGATAKAFTLLRESRIGSTAATWKNVNTWFAFRNAAAHYGAMSRFESLSQSILVAHAKEGLNKADSRAGAAHQVGA